MLRCCLCRPKRRGMPLRAFLFPMEPTLTSAIVTKATSYLVPPFGVIAIGVSNRFNSARALSKNRLGFAEGITHRTAFGGCEQKGATFRTNSCHGSVLRCGSSSGGTHASYHARILSARLLQK